MKIGAGRPRSTSRTLWGQFCHSGASEALRWPPCCLPLAALLSPPSFSSSLVEGEALKASMALWWPLSVSISFHFSPSLPPFSLFSSPVLYLLHFYFYVSSAPIRGHTDQYRQPVSMVQL